MWMTEILPCIKSLSNIGECNGHFLCHFAKKTILVATDAAVLTKIPLCWLSSLANVHFWNSIQSSQCKASPILKIKRLLTLHLHEILYARGLALVESMFYLSTIVICPIDRNTGVSVILWTLHGTESKCFRLLCLCLCLWLCLWSQCAQHGKITNLTRHSK